MSTINRALDPITSNATVWVTASAPDDGQVLCTEPTSLNSCNPTPVLVELRQGNRIQPELRSYMWVSLGILR